MNLSLSYCDHLGSNAIAANKLHSILPLFCFRSFSGKKLIFQLGEICFLLWGIFQVPSKSKIFSLFSPRFHIGIKKINLSYSTKMSWKFSHYNSFLLLFPPIFWFFFFKLHLLKKIIFWLRASLIADGADVIDIVSRWTKYLICTKSRIFLEF